MSNKETLSEIRNHYAKYGFANLFSDLFELFKRSKLHSRDYLRAAAEGINAFKEQRPEEYAALHQQIEQQRTIAQSTRKRYH